MKKTLLATVLFLANSAFADCRDFLLDGTDLQAMIDVARGFGYAALKKDEYGDPEIHGRTQGKPYKIVFYDCNEDRECNEVVFLAQYPLAPFNDAELVNEWNRANRYGTAYVDREKNSLNLTMSLNLNGGITEENFDNNLDIWKNVVGEFQIFLSSRDLGNETWDKPPFDFSSCVDDKEPCTEEDFHQQSMEENNLAENSQEEAKPESKQEDAKEKVEPEKEEPKAEPKQEIEKTEDKKPEDKKEEK